MSSNTVSKQLDQIKILRSENERQDEKIAQQSERFKYICSLLLIVAKTAAWNRDCYSLQNMLARHIALQNC